MSAQTEGTEARRSKAEAESLIPQTFAGFQGVYVWVSQVEADIVADGLDRTRLWMEVQRRLLRGGVPVLQQFDLRQTPMFPCLGVLVHADRAQVSPPFYVFSIEVFFVQRITVVGAPGTNAMRMTWCREAIGDVRKDGQSFDWSNLYSVVGSLVDQFIQDSLGLPAKVPARACN